MQALYDNPRASLKVNGAISNSFGLERGTRQDCPISLLLFAIFIEALSQVINQDDITGIKMLGQVHTIFLLADNILIYLLRPEISILKSSSFLDTFRK